MTRNNPCRAGFTPFRSAAWRGAFLGVVCASFCWALNATPIVQGIDHWLYDSNFLFRGRRPSAAKIVIVAMDEASLDEIEKPLMYFSPELARVVEYLDAQGAAAIGIDFLLPNMDLTLEDMQPGRVGDVSQMGQAVGLAGNVVLPEWFLGNDIPRVPPYEWYDESLPSEQPWADLGFVDFSVDRDSCIRRQQLRFWNQQGVHPSMALALLIKSRGLSQDWLSAEPLLLDGRPIPTDSEDYLLINYVGPPGSIQTVPFRDVLAASKKSKADSPPLPSDESLKKTFQDAVVLVGMTVGTFQDRYPTPYTYPSIVQFLRPATDRQTERQMSGVEIHANMLATLIDRAFLTTPWFLAAPLMLLLVGAALGAVLICCSLETGALVTIAHHFAWRAVSTTAFCLANWRIEMAAMFMLGIMLYGAVFAMRWRWIRRMMGMVKSEAVARALEAGGARLDLRGQQCEISVLFCDIRNFTAYSERHSPHEVVRLLNAFFTSVVPALEAEGGTVNQYIGDAVMVIFGAPRPQPDHAARAVRAARELVRRVHEQTDRWNQLGAEHFRVGVGIHTGRAVVGTVGSPRRLDYTAIGDTVNTASRIESANKELQTEILISEAVFASLSDEEQRRISASCPPKTLSLKGKEKSLRVYELPYMEHPTQKNSREQKK